MAELKAKEIAAEIRPIIEKITAQNYTMAVMDAVGVAMKIAADYKETTGAQKKQFVISAVQLAYKEVNPDIPYLEGMTEDIFETYLVEKLIPATIEIIWKQYGNKILIGSKKEE